jgi:lipoic acid synthetase
LEADEPERVAEAARSLGLKHVVVTSVNRDDLPDEGVGHFVEVIRKLRALSDELIVEILTPDFKRTQSAAVEAILEAGPHIFNHNVETVPRLYAGVRPQAEYSKSLEIFRQIRGRSRQVLTKSGLMLGLGETREEVLAVLRDLKDAGCEMVTIGQYLRSSAMGLPVDRYVSPQEFEGYKKDALEMGFSWVESAPYVRSSYHARDSFEAMKKEIQERTAGLLAKT